MSMVEDLKREKPLLLGSLAFISLLVFAAIVTEGDYRIYYGGLAVMLLLALGAVLWEMRRKIPGKYWRKHDVP